MIAEWLFWLSLACCLGTLCRYFVVSGMGTSTKFGIPLPVLTANLLGCIGFGFCKIALENAGVEPIWQQAVFTGFFGCLTTFSSFSKEAGELILKKNKNGFFIYLGLTLIGGILFYVFGLKLGGLIFSDT